jgi:hypothetical protein
MPSATATISKVRQRIAWLLVNRTPAFAPNAPFVEHSDYCKLEVVTEPGRLRRFEVVAFNPRLAMPWSSTAAAYTQGVAIRMGYSLRREELIEGEAFVVEELKDHDFNQVDGLVVAGAPFSEQDDDHPAIPGVHHAELLDVIEEAGGKVRTIRYGIELEETI